MKINKYILKVILKYFGTNTIIITRVTASNQKFILNTTRKQINI